MALQVRYKRYGLEFTEAYIMLSDFHIQYNCNDAQATITARIFASVTTRDECTEALASVLFMCNADEIVALQQQGDTDPRQPAYRYIKLFYPDAIDV